MDCIGRVLCVTIAPILPHLVIEYYSHHPLLKNQCSDALKQSFSDLSNSILSKKVILGTSNETHQIIEEEKLNLLINNCIFKIRANISKMMFQKNDVNNKNKNKTFTNIQKMVTYLYFH